MAETKNIRISKENYDMLVAIKSYIGDKSKGDTFNDALEYLSKIHLKEVAKEDKLKSIKRENGMLRVGGTTLKTEDKINELSI